VVKPERFRMFRLSLAVFAVAVMIAAIAQSS
jgi:hypothetical protein